MKRIGLVLPVLLFATASFTAHAQDNTINGNAIPEGQQTAVEQHCSELQAQQGTTGTQEPETTMPEGAGNEAQESSNEGAGDAEFDVSAITLEQCIEGGFVEGNVDE